MKASGVGAKLNRCLVPVGHCLFVEVRGQGFLMRQQEHLERIARSNSRSARDWRFASLGTDWLGGESFGGKVVRNRLVRNRVD